MVVARSRRGEMWNNTVLSMVSIMMVSLSWEGGVLLTMRDWLNHLRSRMERTKVILTRVKDREVAPWYDIARKPNYKWSSEHKDTDDLSMQTIAWTEACELVKCMRSCFSHPIHISDRSEHSPQKSFFHIKPSTYAEIARASRSHVIHQKTLHV